MFESFEVTVLIGLSLILSFIFLCVYCYCCHSFSMIVKRGLPARGRSKKRLKLYSVVTALAIFVYISCQFVITNCVEDMSKQVLLDYVAKGYTIYLDGHEVTVEKIDLGVDSFSCHYQDCGVNHDTKVVFLISSD